MRATRTGKAAKADKKIDKNADGRSGEHAGNRPETLGRRNAGQAGRADPGGEAGGAVVPVDEPSLPRRIRRRGDAIRLSASLAALGLVLLLPSIARQTTTGIQSDITHGTAQTPHFLLALANLVSTFGLLAVPVAFAIERLIRRDGLRVAVGLLAAVIALGVTLALDSWVASGPSGLVEYLAWTRRSGGAVPDPLHTDLTPVIAYVTAVRLGGRPRWQAVTWTVIALAALAALAAGYASPLALAVTYFIGRAIGYGTLYVVGTPNPRPAGTAVIAVLRRLGMEPCGAARVPDGPEESRRYTVELAGGGPRDGAARLSVTVLDRDQQTSGVFYRMWRRVRLRSGPRRPVRSLRRSLEQESLMSYAVTAAGVGTPRLIATSEVGTDAALLAFEDVPGVPLGELPRKQITDELLTAIWRQLRQLDAHRLAHRHLEAGSILVGQDGRPYLVDLRSGEIAASDLVRRLDLAQLLTTLALRVGPERSVATAADVLGADQLAAAVPLLQKVALSRGTRAALRRERDLLPRIRDQILRLRPEIEAEPVRLERFRPRTVVSIVAGTAAGYILLSQLSNADLRLLIREADWWWAGIGLVAAGTTYLAAAMMIIGFVPERLPMIKTVLVQLAGSFIKLAAPAAVTVVAVNTRYLQREGVRPGQAVASVGASQLTGLITHVMLLILFGFGTGYGQAESLTPSRTVVVVLLALAVAAAAVTTVPPARRLVVRRLRSLFSGVVPRLLDVLQTPRKLLTGLGGTLLLTASFVVCLEASIRAFGGSIGWTTVVIIFLTGNALGSAAPTPGGLGAVEGALTLGLTVGGLPAGTATSAVLLFRMLTFWLPVLPGWAAFAYLQRKEAI
ncbi:MAG TPA: lysylphosphatidylglycerol synthase domain-containing protein [Streptosporangiaceae bacterium]|nr:lysylphosphatidylglycerol synthase domain-containing protein [Streptosporangiaceae bacterium]